MSEIGSADFDPYAYYNVSRPSDTPATPAFTPGGSQSPYEAYGVTPPTQDQLAEVTPPAGEAQTPASTYVPMATVIAQPATGDWLTNIFSGVTDFLRWVSAPFTGSATSTTATEAAPKTEAKPGAEKTASLTDKLLTAAAPALVTGLLNYPAGKYKQEQDEKEYELKKSELLIAQEAAARKKKIDDRNDQALTALGQNRPTGLLSYLQNRKDAASRQYQPKGLINGTA